MNNSIDEYVQYHRFCYKIFRAKTYIYKTAYIIIIVVILTYVIVIIIDSKQCIARSYFEIPK